MSRIDSADDLGAGRATDECVELAPYPTAVLAAAELMLTGFRAEIMARFDALDTRFPG